MPARTTSNCASWLNVGATGGHVPSMARWNTMRRPSGDQSTLE